MNLNSILCGFLVILLLYNEISAFDDNPQLTQTAEEDMHQKIAYEWNKAINSETESTIERPIIPTRDWRNLDDENSVEKLFKLHIENIKKENDENNRKISAHPENTGIKPTGWWNFPHENYHNGDEVDLPETVNTDYDKK